MALFKCKMCGGNIEFNPGDAVGTCDSCGSVQTLPKGNDEVINNLFNRANNLRLKSEFDKAAEVYEKILNENESDAEAHWGLVLCKYGIEYVEDPATYKRVPTCHRAQYESILTDADYIAAIENSDTAQQGLFTQQALEISNIQKGILAIVNEEKPFDVFICYKETDENGKRTVDSALANDIYYQLTQEGLKAFYAAITLEDKLGQEYEPYIFAALHSAKVMLVVGTKPEYFEAVWVRNEWSRFLKLMKTDRTKLLIPCYRDMDAYNLPEEFAHLQAQDMSKIGFVNDVVRGIKKVIGDGDNGTAKETVVVASESTAAVAPLLKRAFMFLEDGKWAEADEYCEKVLDLDPENAEAYLGKLMAELKVKNKDGLKDAAEPFDGKDNAVKAGKFDSSVAEKLKSDNDYIRERNETARKQGVYDNAFAEMRKAKSEVEFKTAAGRFETIRGFKDADEKVAECLEKAEIARKDAIYDDASSYLAKNDKSSVSQAEYIFRSIIDWKDSRTKIDECTAKIKDIKIAEEKAEAERKRKAEEARIAAEKEKARNKKIAMIGGPIVAVLLVFIIVLITVILPAANYKKALAAVDAGDYNMAYLLFNIKPDYKDTKDQIAAAKLKEATALLDAKKYDEAYEILEEIGNKDAISESMYNRAVEFVNEDDKLSAYMIFAQITGYKDSDSKAAEYKPLYIKNLLSNAKVGDKVVFGSYEQDNDTNNGKEDIEWRVLAKEGNKILVISEYALDCQQYNKEYTSVTWEKCTLRKWLNDTFFKAAFGSAEQSMIKSTKVTADNNPNYSTSPGNDTTDKVFLLSITEAEKYFSSDDDRMCVPTKYAIENGANTSSYYKKDGEATCWWWLRSVDSDSGIAASVDHVGDIRDAGGFVSVADCVRPALWIEIV